MNVMRLIKILFTVLIFSTNTGYTQNQKPNFLFLFTDDQTYKSIHALNNEEVETPNMDKLVEEGVTFTHCFNQGGN